MELNNTVSLMLSEDHKDRFKAEYYQLLIRYVKLRNMVNNWDKLKFTPVCHKDTYIDQLKYMQQYMFILERRAKVENIFTDKEIEEIFEIYSEE